MNIIKTILKYRGQDASQVLQVKGQRRVADDIAFTRHLIKYFLHRKIGYSTMGIQRHMKPLSDGFNHSSTLHSVHIVHDQHYIFSAMVEDIEKQLQITNNEILN